MITRKEYLVKEITRIRELMEKHLKKKDEFAYNTCKDYLGKLEARLDEHNVIFSRKKEGTSKWKL